MPDTARIEDVPTEQFNRILHDYLASGWRKVYEYGGWDAWIDYGRVDLKRDGRTLCFEWTNWFEGEISGPASVIRELADTYGLRLA